MQQAGIHVLGPFWRSLKVASAWGREERKACAKRRVWSSTQVDTQMWFYNRSKETVAQALPHLPHHLSSFPGQLQSSQSPYCMLLVALQSGRPQATDTSTNATSVKNRVARMEGLEDIIMAVLICVGSGQESLAC